MADDCPGIMLNLASVDPAHEDEFNRWYHAEHIPDVLARFPQIKRVRRFRAADAEEPRYLVLYEYDVAHEAELKALMSAEYPLRQELWKLYDDAVGAFAKRSRRAFWQIYPPRPSRAGNSE